MNKPESMCMAAWCHTYLSPQTERRQCCASREDAQSFEQYIDTGSGSGIYHPLTLEEWWNGEHMRSVRQRMLAGETLPECDVCNSKLLNVDVYRSYFNQMFSHKFDEAYASTDNTGYTTMQPISWDYRFSNLCNFKCRMCGDMLSSQWENEQRTHNMINWHNPKNNWMKTDVRASITEFQKTIVEQEFAKAVEEHRIEEIYWVGGESLHFSQHWKYMKRIVELGDGPNVYARYNTNLSRIHYGSIDLCTDILQNIRDWQICASLDGTGAIGEYIRTGLDYKKWLDNFSQVRKIATNRRQLRIDFTLTLPGMFELENIEQLSEEFDVDILAKVVFSFSPDIILSPLSLPKEILHPWIDELYDRLHNSTLREMLMQLKNRPTFEEQWPNNHGLIAGKERILNLEKIRNDKYILEDILQGRQDVHEWYKRIDATG